MMTKSAQKVTLSQDVPFDKHVLSQPNVRRFQALSFVVKQKRLTKTTPIPCFVRDTKSTILAEYDSLAENMQPCTRLISSVPSWRCGRRDREI